jgi:hypothetical protein
MVENANVPLATEACLEKKKPYSRPMMVEIGTTKNIVQSLYANGPNDGYQGYNTYIPN